MFLNLIFTDFKISKPNRKTWSRAKEEKKKKRKSQVKYCKNVLESIYKHT